MGFEAAARLGNFSRAADELCLSQSAISHQISQLEAQLGQTLFRRAGRGVELTMAGKYLLSTVTRSLDVIRSGLDRVGTYLDAGLVVIVCPAPVAHGWLQPRLQQLAATLPALCPLISTDESARYVDEVDVDITISERPLQQTGLIERPFLTDQMITVARADIAARLNAMPVTEHAAQVAMVCLEQELLDDGMGKHLRQHFSAFRRAALFDDRRLLLESVTGGNGVALVSRLSAAKDLAAGTLHEIAGYPSIDLPRLWISRMAGESRSTLIPTLFDALCVSAG